MRRTVAMVATTSLAIAIFSCLAGWFAFGSMGATFAFIEGKTIYVEPDYQEIESARAGERLDMALRVIRQARPSLPIVLMSGYCSEELSSRFANERITGFLQEPFSVEIRRRANCVRSSTPPRKMADVGGAATAHRHSSRRCRCRSINSCNRFSIWCNA